MPAENASAGTPSKENRYPAQITNIPVKTAQHRGTARLRAVAITSLQGGRSAAKYQTSAAPIDDGINARAENFERTASPVAAPNNRLYLTLGLSIQSSAVSKDAPTKAARAI